MNTILQKNVDLFSINRDAMRDAFFLQNGELILLGAAIITSQGITATKEKLEECEEIMRKHEGVFSSFRSGHIKTAVVAKMVCSKDPENYVVQLRKVKDELDKDSFFHSEFAALAAMVLLEREEIAKNNPEISFNLEDAIKETLRIYKEINQKHPILTSKDDLPSIALLATSDIDHNVLVDRCEECMVAVKEKMGFWTSDVPQSIGFVLALSNKSTEEKCQYVYDIYEKVKDQGTHPGRSYELCVLAAGSLLDVPVNTYAQGIDEAYEAIKEILGMSGWFMSSSQKTMYSAMLVLMEYLPEDKSIQSALVISTVVMIIMEEIIIAGILASSTANNSNN